MQSSMTSSVRLEKNNVLAFQRTCVAGVGFVNGLFQLLTIKTISIGSIHTLYRLSQCSLYTDRLDTKTAQGKNDKDGGGHTETQGIH